ncbi:hypothetical protein MPSEU_000225400 [Mayamaea pseudoterrestris]|nr:hypothetical protein MPSEU_000225400 [Mayamaea pseudoterrestris]
MVAPQRRLTASLSLLLALGLSSRFTQSFVAVRTPAPRQILHRLHEASLSDKSSSNDNDYMYHPSEFLNLEPLPPPSDRRLERLQQEMEAQSQFVTFGDELWKLRANMDDLSKQLVQKMRASLQQQNKQNKKELEHVDDEFEHIRQQLRRMEAQDPELVYKLELSDAKEAISKRDKERHEAKAVAARSCLPQFQLDGLWVGKYGAHGYELINVTYVGDTLFATKVTGDRNVPRGEITFQIDLSPLRSATDAVLQPIVLSEKAASKWKTQKLPRYGGLGQVAENGFRNHQWMDGQLIIIGKDYFSFAWIPIEQQIFFGRPSPELALKMLREHGVAPLRSSVAAGPVNVDDQLEVQKEYAMRCLEMTDEVFEDELDLELDDAPGFSCIWRGNDSDECYFE